MIEFMEGSMGRIVGLRATGRLKEADYRDLLPKLEELFRQHGKLDLLFYMDEGFEGWDMQAAWDDASFGFSHAGDFERLAVVGAPAWVNWCIRLSSFLFKCEVRIFPGEALEEAWGWVKGASVVI
ncbi:STAS/SEC14 domain-containing protein [Ostreiculturibacter nitratireducens]|uniref:STAS/SEC14 domain-containing protein n=1 Tax=Ostreiculturibacter nitratireducens TaxID=3075226 RepID=UPI0031B5C9CD